MVGKPPERSRIRVLWEEGREEGTAKSWLHFPSSRLPPKPQTGQEFRARKEWNRGGLACLLVLEVWKEGRKPGALGRGDA